MYSISKVRNERRGTERRKCVREREEEKYERSLPVPCPDASSTI